ncbi:NAD(+) synthase [Frankia sp. CNm7]|uniref:Glutamine-dependent NAD(+) synthetase n=1 Tax=Frankia nepalensis TaxID=1836974 RepID=A0A937RFM8_9ACTN|nr:NAD(+) synthase [Frankia nepalensis]MBL7501111.1 NAD(+) synthase [Frankia nepalensis]MBL7512733.1 NAD(+) synthase [Frankia nepalensis]MBL7524123.1 NAD(+) synthase [Frankia nepalensis]MBL7631311.1 NAD(+) synthase [Frankia nepalensis]
MSQRAFGAIHSHGLVRAAAATPLVATADPARNAEATTALARRADADGVDVVVYPELGISSYAIDDLHLQDALLDAVEDAVAAVRDATRDLAPLLLVGAPLRRRGRLYNTALAISRGRVLGVVPKTYLPNYREYYEKRWFASGGGIVGEEITVAGDTVPFGTDLLFAAKDLPELVVGVEICEDYWGPLPPSSYQALAGATLLTNLSASNIVVGKSAERALLSAAQSARAMAAYVYSAAGTGESTTDLSWDGQGTIHELGDLLAESDRFAETPQLLVADVDLARVRLERMRTPTFNDNAVQAGHPERRFRTVGFEHRPHRRDVGLRRRQRRFPYVPDTPERLDLDCYEAFNIQVHGLARRFRSAGGKTMVIGVSGGLDSTHALIVAAKACDRLGVPRSSILAYTLPGFATGEKTKANAWALMRALGVEAAEIDIRPAARQMLADLGHPVAAGEPVYDVTFENVQAGLRTDYLFRLANQRGGFVIGTGDLSELALGWCTYGVGDQMSHYAVNAGVPKTLIQYLIRWTITSGQFDEATGELLTAILGTEISPELVPADEETGAMQSTEDRIGPYELHDFFLYHVLRYGLPPSKVAFLAWHAWGDADAGRWPAGFPDDRRHAYDVATIVRWLEEFLQRFFQLSQFKRSALPNGPKVSYGGTLSPRGDWRAPSDGSAAVWLAELRRNGPTL